MADISTPNLPSRNFDLTAKFYADLGFGVIYRDKHWMIMTRGAMTLEFFPHADLDPATSWFSCCLRMDDLTAFYLTCKSVGLPETTIGQPRLHPPLTQDWGGMMGAMIDLDGTLVRLIQN